MRILSCHSFDSLEIQSFEDSRRLQFEDAEIGPGLRVLVDASLEFSKFHRATYLTRRSKLVEIVESKEIVVMLSPVEKEAFESIRIVTNQNPKQWSTSTDINRIMLRRGGRGNVSTLAAILRKFEAMCLIESSQVDRAHFDFGWRLSDLGEYLHAEHKIK